MKKLISTISTLVLIFMIPALFIGYLYNDNLTGSTDAATGKNKIEQVNGNQETGFTPGISFTVKG